MLAHQQSVLNALPRECPTLPNFGLRKNAGSAVNKDNQNLLLNILDLLAHLLDQHFQLH